MRIREWTLYFSTSSDNPILFRCFWRNASFWSLKEVIWRFSLLTGSDCVKVVYLVFMVVMSFLKSMTRTLCGFD
jgi:hypothetical protein